MDKPEMIIFDYGHTLLYEPGHSSTNGNRAIYNYIKKNPRNISFEEYDRTITDIFAKIKEQRGTLLEIHEHDFLRVAWEYMEIEMSVSMEEAEKIIWNGISPGKVMPCADRMIDYLNSEEIRTGVISNLCFSGAALKERLDRLLPNNRFEFVLASSEYIFQKPHGMMFEIALKKAGLSADKVWFCGDTISADIYGAHAVGMFPVFYEGEVEDDIMPAAHLNEGMKIDFECLHIKDWNEMVEFLEKMK